MGLNSLLTIRENYCWGLWPCPEDATLHQAAVQLDLAEILDRECGQLSAGQQRRASLLHLLLRKVPLWLLDEPLNGLDGKAVDCLTAMIKTHIAQQGAVVLTSHQSFPPLLAAIVQEYDL